MLIPKHRLLMVDEKYAKTLVKFVMSGGFIDINKGITNK